MTTILFTLILVGLLAYGLERNRSRQQQPRSRLAGSYDVIDRDSERFGADLRAAAARR